ncbi:ParA family protein [bacterium]|nr:ParA family protein [bacterium]
MPRIIAIANQKGGVGKTTSAINLSACLAETGRRTLLVDLDPQGNASSGLGLPQDVNRPSAFDVFDNAPPISDIVLPTAVPNLSVIPANIDLVGVERGLAEDPDAPYYLRRFFDASGFYAPADEPMFHYVLIDCPPSLGILTANALVAAHTLLAPVQCEFFALEGLTKLHLTYNHVRSHHNPDLELEGILLTMVDPRTNLSTQVEQEIRGYYKDGVFQATIPRGVRLSEAPSFGQPITVYDPASKGAAAYRSLCQEVISNETKRLGPWNQRPHAGVAGEPSA